MKRIVFVYIMILLYHNVNAQNSIFGKITDTNQIPLTGATVFVPDMNKGTVADANGLYEMTNLPNGKVKIQVSFLGYANHIETLELIGNRIELNVVLHETAIEAEEIVISGGYNSTQHQNAVKIEVLDLNPNTIKATPNFTEVLTQVPGIDMISKGSGVAKPVIRGLSMNDILVLNNGVRFENYQYSSHHPLGIDEFGIDDVEIIKGPASLLYGSDAIGGVLNFIHEKPAPMGTLVGDYNLQLFSNTMGITNNLGLKGASKKFFGGVRFGQKSNADFLQGGGDFVPNSRFTEMAFNANGGFTDKIGTFKLNYDFNNQKLGLVEDEALEEIEERGRKNELFYQQFNTHLLSSQNKLYLGKFKLDLNSAYQNTELIHFGEPNVYEIQMELATLTYDAKLHMPSTNHSEYILGFQGFNQTNTNLNNRETILLPNANTNNYSAFGLIQFSPFEPLTLQTGIRYDTRSIITQSVGSLADSASYRAPLDKAYNSFSGSVGATFHASETLLFRANLATAYRTPNIAELTSNGQHELRYEVGDPNLVPENSYEADLSLHYHSDNVSADVAGFYNRVNHFIFIAPTGDTTATSISIYKYKQANSALYGGEAGLHLHPKNVPWLHVETTFASVIGKQIKGDYLPFIPAHKWRFEVRAEREQLWFFNEAFVTVNSNTAFAQNNVAPDETATNGYTLIDVSVGGKIKLNHQMVLVSLSANNLFDTKYIDHLSTLKEVNYFNPGRNLALSLKIPFGIVAIK